MFATRLSYVIQTGGTYQLQISDSDGQDARIALTAPSRSSRPRGRPTAPKVAYVSFEKKKPIVYIHVLPTGQRIVVSNQKATTARRRGRRMAASSRSRCRARQHADLRVNADGSGLRRLTQGSSIDTEPTYSPDGNSIFFTSDRGGQPQIYKMSA